ncbi:MAG: efflux RND transporter periplasmic adaptor subunit [Proteobacteria bacterium]|nr:efflux RND transporter periplasmic adaptor subunit [Pseudomonadota bacterium]
MNLINTLKNNPWWIAGGILLLVVVWMLTGIGSSNEASSETASDPDVTKSTDVRVRQQQAEPVESFVDVYGRTAPARMATLKAETDGRVVEVTAERGAYARKGAALVLLDVRNRNEQIERARAELKAAKMRFDAEKSLQHENFASETRLAEAQAQLEAARAELRRIQVDLANTRIKAPFNGALQERLVEVGDYVAVGDPVATFVDIDTLIVTGSVSETERTNLEIGATATAKLITGQTIEGRVRYIDPVAEESTRTFKIELEVPNNDHALPAGVTAQIHVPAGRRLAHRISPAILTLDDNGEIGIKTVADDNTVRFSKVDIVKSGVNGMWISGLPDEANIITVGQGFVKPGDTVNPVFEEKGAQNAAGAVAANTSETR